MDCNFKKINNWINNLCSEVGAHDAGIFCLDKTSDARLSVRPFVYQYDEGIKFRAGDIVLDVGSGALPIYGNLIGREAKINYIPVDSLVYEYEKLYEKYNIHLPVKPNFGIMETLSRFYPHNYADFVICNNALDHSIDIIASLFEFVAVTKIGGHILLAHHINEAEHNDYDGLHQWNIGAENGHLFFHNRDIRYDVSDILKSFCDVRISSRKDNERASDMIVADIIKKEDIHGDVYRKYVDYDFSSCLIQCFFETLASRSLGYSTSGEDLLKDGKSYVVWGIGNVGVECLSWFGNKRSLIKYYVDYKAEAVDEWHGYSVKLPQEYKRTDGFLIIASTQYENDITDELISLGYVKERDYLPYREFKKFIQENR